MENYIAKDLIKKGVTKRKIMKLLGIRTDRFTELYKEIKIGKGILNKNKDSN